MTAHRPNPRPGFTLVEALAVMALMGAVLPVVMYAISNSTSAASLVRQRALAAELAANKLSEIVVGNQWQTGTLSGDVAQEGVTFHWAANVQDWTVANTSQIALQVTWTGRGRARSVTLTTVVYNGGNSATGSTGGNSL
jgi:type II secretion system protein I